MNAGQILFRLFAETSLSDFLVVETDVKIFLESFDPFNIIFSLNTNFCYFRQKNFIACKNGFLRFGFRSWIWWYIENFDFWDFVEFYFQLILIHKIFLGSRIFARVSVFVFLFSVNFRESLFVINLLLFSNNCSNKSENSMSLFIFRIAQLGNFNSSIFFPDFRNSLIAV